MIENFYGIKFYMSILQIIIICLNSYVYGKITMSPPYVHEMTPVLRLKDFKL